MAIEKKELMDVSTSIRSLYQKAVKMLENDTGIDYGVELLKSVVQREPGFLLARAALRDAERRKSDKLGGFAKFMAKLKSGSFIAKAKLGAGKNPKEAMSQVEEALALYLYSPAALGVLSDAAQAADAGFIAIESLELVQELEPANEANMNKLIDLYKADGNGNKVLTICQKLANLHPNDLELQSRVREAAALATMTDTWNNKGGTSFRDKMKKEEEAEEKNGDKILRNEDDIAAEIAKMEQKIAANDKEAESLDFRRRLADYYMKLNHFENAINTYNWIVQKMGTLDPAIDKAIEKANVGIGKMNIEAMRAAGSPETEIQAQEQEIYAYRLERYEERVSKYPNDLMLKYELAELYWEGGNVDGALEQFQLAQRQPQKRLSAIVYLGRCFHAKKQFDMAIEQFDKALKEMLTMDEQKMETLYYLGLAYEEMGRKKDALDCFKQIYSADITFRDVKERVAANYGE